MALRLIDGIEPREDFPAIGIMQELLCEKHLLISEHTQRHLREEIFFPGPVIDRANRSRWEKQGAPTLRQRAHLEVEKLLENYRPTELSKEVRKELVKLMNEEARRYGQENLPDLPPID